VEDNKAGVEAAAASEAGLVARVLEGEALDEKTLKGKSLLADFGYSSLMTAFFHVQSTQNFDIFEEI